jgi:uncharacterized OsmC-like protein
MTGQKIAAAMQRVVAVLQRRPHAGLHDDVPAAARWESGMRIATSHANGTVISTDMPGELGGSGDRITPGWLFRAGLASCFATCIAMRAAAEGIELGTLSVEAGSRSDTRGLLGVADLDGGPVDAGPHDVQMRVRLSAHGIPEERLRALVEESNRCSPVPSAVRNAVPVSLHIEVDRID